MPGASFQMMIANARRTPYSASSATPSGYGGANFTVSNRSFQLTNGATIESIGTYQNAAITVVVKILKRNSAGNYDVVVSESYSHAGGTTWQDHTLSSPYVVPGSGDYFAAVYSASNWGFVASTLRSYVAGDATGTSVAMTEDTNNAAVVRVSGYL